MNIDNPVAHVIPTGLEQDRRIEEDELRPALLGPRDLPAKAPLDPRIPQSLQRGHLPGIGEHDGAEPAPIDRSLRVQHRAAPALDPSFTDLRLPQRLMPRLVS